MSILIAGSVRVCLSLLQALWAGISAEGCLQLLSMGAVCRQLVSTFPEKGWALELTSFCHLYLNLFFLSSLPECLLFVIYESQGCLYLNHG